MYIKNDENVEVRKYRNYGVFGALRSHYFAPMHQICTVFMRCIVKI